MGSLYHLGADPRLNHEVEPSPGVLADEAAALLAALLRWDSGSRVAPGSVGRRRVARVDEWDGLENRCGRKATVGSNPTLSAIAGHTT